MAMTEIMRVAQLVWDRLVRDFIHILREEGEEMKGRGGEEGREVISVIEMTNNTVCMYMYVVQMY